MTNEVFVVEVDGVGEEATTLKQVANLLGVKRVAKKDVEPGGKYSDVVSLTSDLEEDTEDVSEPTEEVLTKEEDTKEDTKALTKEEDTKALTKEKVSTDTDTDVEYPERGTYTDPKDLKKFYKKLDNDQLDEWLELEGLEYKPNDNPSIDRMRKCMAILYYHFPKAPATKKSKSKYAEYTTEELVQMAMDNDVEVKDDKGDERILRMYTIMALREAGIIS